MKYATGLSTLCGASVLLVYPVELPVPLILGNPSPVGLGSISEQVWADSEREAKSRVQGAIDTMADLGVPAEGRILLAKGGVGMAVKEASGKCDLVVVPQARARGFERLLHHDRAVDVVKNAECPVVVVRASEEAHPWAAGSPVNAGER